MADVRTYFYANDQYLGRMRTENFISLSIIYICPICGDSWGRRRVKVDGEEQDYVPFTEMCLNHGNSPLISPFDPIEALPEAVMAREICYAIQEWLCQE